MHGQPVLPSVWFRELLEPYLPLTVFHFPFSFGFVCLFFLFGVFIFFVLLHFLSQLLLKYYVLHFKA